MSAALAQETTPVGVRFRAPAAGDADFIFRSWLDAYGLGSPITVNIKKSLYYPGQRAAIGRLLQRNPAAVVACLEGDPAVLLGFLVAELGGERPVVHFAYVKGPFRRLGIAGGMLAALGVAPDRCVFTHWTYDTVWLARKFPRASYNPFLA